MKKTLFFLFLIIGLVGSSCRKDDDIITGGPDPVIFVQTQVMGMIRDEQGKGLGGVNIRWGQQVATTDENGYYTFQGAAADEQGTVLQISASGYFDLTKTVVPIPNGRTWLEAILTPKVLNGTVQASAGGTVSLTGATITLPAGGIVGSGNVPYTGTVHVYATWLDPTAPETRGRMPGDLSAVNADAESGILASYGMIGVELETAAGAPLQIAQGAEAEIRMTIPSALLANAPATIPLWHFDVVKGKWIEEGFAEKTGNEYVGKVSHFSFWNCDVFFENVVLKGRVVNGNGTPITGVWVQATLVNGSQNLPVSTSASTNSDGMFGGKVPAGEVILIEIVDQCGEVVYSQQVGPLSADLDMGDLLVSFSDKSIEITGTVVDCDDQPVLNGYIVVQVEGKQVILPLASGGSFLAVIPTCDANELIAKGVDVTNLKASPPLTYPISGLNSLDLGEIAACDELDEFLQYTLDGLSIIVIEPGAGIQGNILQINSGNSPDSSYFYMTLNQIIPGTYNPVVVEVSSYDPVSGSFVAGYCQGCADMDVTIISVGNIGEPIIGSFSGTLDGNPSNPMQPLSGSFKIIRDN